MKATLRKLNNFANSHEYLLVLLAFLVALRLPSIFEPFWYGDENIYLAIGQALRKGSTLYQTITDYPNKPPGIYFLAAIAQDVFRFRLLLLFWQIPGVIAFYQLSKRITKNQHLTFFTTLAFIYLTSTPLLEGNIANAENFFLVLTTISIAIIYNKKDLKKHKVPRPKVALFSGCILGLSLLFKVHVIMDLATLGFVFYILTAKTVKGVFSNLLSKSLLSFFFGLTIPMGMALLALSISGVSPTDLLSDASGSTQYVSVWQSDQFIEQIVLLGSLQARVVILGIIILLLFILRRKFESDTLFITVWMIFATFAALLSARPYPHYLLQVMPPLALSGGVLFAKRPLRSKALVIGAIVLLVCAYVRFDFSTWGVTNYYNNFIKYSLGKIDRTEYYRRFDNRMPRNYRLAQKITEITSPSHQIYLWSTDPGVYVMANRLQVTKLVTSFHVDDLDYYDETLAQLRQTKPEVIVVMESEWRDFAGLDTFLNEKYRLYDQISNYPQTDHIRGQRALVYKLR